MHALPACLLASKTSMIITKNLFLKMLNSGKIVSRNPNIFFKTSILLELMGKWYTKSDKTYAVSLLITRIVLSLLMMAK